MCYILLLFILFWLVPSLFYLFRFFSLFCPFVLFVFLLIVFSYLCHCFVILLFLFLLLFFSSLFFLLFCYPVDLLWYYFSTLIPYFLWLFRLPFELVLLLGADSSHCSLTTFGVTILFGLISLLRLISTLKWRFVVSVNMPIDSLVVNTLVTSVHVVSYFGSISYQDVVRSMDLLLKSLLDVILLVIVEIVMNSYYYRHLKRVPCAS